MAGNWRAEIIGGCWNNDTQATDAALDPDVTVTFLDANSVALTVVNVILGSGNSGQSYLLIATDVSNAIEIKITNWQGGLTNQMFSFAKVGDYMAIEWNGREWVLLEKTVGVVNTT